MNPDLLDVLSCPACGGGLRPGRCETKGHEIVSGVLTCRDCTKPYVVEGGIPRFAPEATAARDRHWEAYHRRVPYDAVVAHMRRRFQLPRGVLLDYYRHAGLLVERGERAGRVLELGAGSGSYTLALAQLAGAERICLLDVSPAALAGARRVFAAFGLTPDLVQGDIRSLPFRPRAFDLALSGGLIEHFAGDTQAKIVAEHTRVADRALIQAPAPTPAYWAFRLAYSFRPGGWPFGYERPVSRRRLRALLDSAGFSPVAWDGHDFASAAALLGAMRWRRFPRFHRWPGLARTSRHDGIVLAAPTGTS